MRPKRAGQDWNPPAVVGWSQIVAVRWPGLRYAWFCAITISVLTVVTVHVPRQVLHLIVPISASGLDSVPSACDLSILLRVFATQGISPDVRST